MVRKPGGNHRMIIKILGSKVPRTTLAQAVSNTEEFGVTQEFAHRTREDLADAGRRDAR